MSLEQVIAENTAAIKELIAVFQGANTKTAAPKAEKVEAPKAEKAQKAEPQSSGATSAPESTAPSDSGTSEPITFAQLADLFRALLASKGPEVGRATLDLFTKGKLSAIPEDQWEAAAEAIRKAGA